MHGVRPEKLRRRRQSAPEASQLVRNEAIVLEGADTKREVRAGVLHILEGIIWPHNESEVGVSLPYPRKEFSGDECAILWRRGYGDLTGNAGVLLPRDIRKQVNLGKNGTDAVVQPFPDLCEPDGSCPALQQAHPKMVFQQRDVTTDT